MAKINIDFNNQTYEIDESALAKAAASLSSHLSTVMNGSGATINLNGVTYSVDSSKLSTATNAFVSYLGTVSGNGSKVVVNGVEYTVDATKMTKATAELQAVLGDLVSGGNAGGDSSQEVIFPEQTLTGFVENNLSFFNVSLEPAPFTLTDGMAYRVAWDGEVYDVTAVYSSDWEITYIGDGSLLGLPGNGEPFVIVDQGDLIEVHSTTDASQSHTVAIYKAMSDNGDSDAPVQSEYGLYFGKKYNGYTGGDSVSILMSMMFGADGSNTVYSGDGNIIANNPAGTVTYEGNAICLNGEPWYIVSEDGVMLITATTNSVGFVLDPSVGITSAVVPDGVTRIGDTNEAPFAYYDILTSITIPASVTSIGGYAFYGCTSLTTITFEGTMAQWNAIAKGDDWNHNVPATTVQCSDGTVTI